MWAKNSSSGIFAIRDNTTSNTPGAKGLKKNFSEITCYNNYKKGHYAWTSSKFKKDNAQKNYK